MHSHYVVWRHVLSERWISAGLEVESRLGCTSRVAAFVALRGLEREPGFVEGWVELRGGVRIEPSGDPILGD